MMKVAFLFLAGFFGMNFMANAENIEERACSLMKSDGVCYQTREFYDDEKQVTGRLTGIRYRHTLQDGTVEYAYIAYKVPGFNHLLRLAPLHAICHSLGFRKNTISEGVVLEGYITNDNTCYRGEKSNLKYAILNFDGTLNRFEEKSRYKDEIYAADSVNCI